VEDAAVLSAIFNDDKEREIANQTPSVKIGGCLWPSLTWRKTTYGQMFTFLMMNMTVMTSRMI